MSSSISSYRSPSLSGSDTESAFAESLRTMVWEGQICENTHSTHGPRRMAEALSISSRTLDARRVAKLVHDDGNLAIILLRQDVATGSMPCEPSESCGVSALELVISSSATSGRRSWERSICRSLLEQSRLAAT